MVSLRHQMSRFWTDDKGLSAFLGLLLLTTFVLPPFFQPRGTGRALVDIVFCLVLVGGALTAPLHRRVGWFIAAVGLVATLARVLDWTFASNYFKTPTAVSTLVTLVLLAIVVLAQVLRSGPVTIHRIVGAIAAYILFGLSWGFAYQVVEALAPGAFKGLAAEYGARDLIYYSFVTLTTIGYGDITPVHNTARSLAMLEGLTGQLYPAILVARLVSLEVQSRTPPSAGGNRP